MATTASGRPAVAPSLFETASTWQQTTLGASKRQIPDIAYDASTVTGAEIIIGGQRYSVGGTSLASPIFVGVFARAQTVCQQYDRLPGQLHVPRLPEQPGRAA